jgi:hypothetical protein
MRQEKNASAFFDLYSMQSKNSDEFGRRTAFFSRTKFFDLVAQEGGFIS